ncbi:RNA polymerase sigma factor [Chondromyces crocatus]|uniref:RNA polymerase sigma factor n=1 Tax=Chondromyces crocatus TaxID=52 RepID=A0A0K1ENV7_CHOCO|nr:RNA polymerase sigma factor [Chondromyces crocatus]AKT42580.1 uncharacterized protein CMC5_068070 [Chondromyces crocatus]
METSPRIADGPAPGGREPSVETSAVSAEESDAALVERLRRRDPRAFDAVYARYHGRLWSFLVRLAGRREVAEDLIQETWMQVARYAEKLNEDTDLRAWLFTVARNRHRSHRRWAMLGWGAGEVLTVEPVDPAPGLEVVASARAAVRSVEEGLRALPEAHREVLLLSAVEGLDAAQVGAVLGIREDAARKRLSRARAELAVWLEKREAEGAGSVGGRR